MLEAESLNGWIINRCVSERTSEADAGSKDQIAKRQTRKQAINKICPRQKKEEDRKKKKKNVRCIELVLHKDANCKIRIHPTISGQKERDAREIITPDSTRKEVQILQTIKFLPSWNTLSNVLVDQGCSKDL